jgi:hypothetical protein
MVPLLRPDAGPDKAALFHGAGTGSCSSGYLVSASSHKLKSRCGRDSGRITVTATGGGKAPEGRPIGLAQAISEGRFKPGPGYIQMQPAWFPATRNRPPAGAPGPAEGSAASAHRPVGKGLAVRPSLCVGALSPQGQPAEVCGGRTSRGSTAGPWNPPSPVVRLHLGYSRRVRPCFQRLKRNLAAVFWTPPAARSRVRSIGESAS